MKINDEQLIEKMTILFSYENGEEWPEDEDITNMDITVPNDHSTEPFEINGREYLVLDGDEAHDLAKEYIQESLWAFNPEFIIDHSKLPYEAVEMVRSFQESECEDANDTIEALIEDMDEFVDDAISADGVGHFLASYDGEEHEAKNYYYIYRVN